MGYGMIGRQDSLDSQTSTSSSEGVNTCNDLRRSWAMNRLAHKCLAILHGEYLHVTALALSRGFLYAGSDHGEMRTWGPPDLREGTKFLCSDEAGAVKCVVVVGNKVISGHQDHKIRVWRRSKSNAQEHHLVTTLSSAKDCITNFLPAKTLGRRSHQTSLWINHHDSISSLAVGNGVLYSGSWDKSIKVWRLSDFRCLESIDEHLDAVNALAVDKQNDLLYSGSGDTTIKIFQKYGHRDGHQESTDTTKQHHHVLLVTLEAKSPVNALALSPDGSILYSGQSDKTVTVWKMSDDGNSKQWCAVGALRGHRLSILCLRTFGDNLVVTGSADKTVRVWKRNSYPDGSIYHSCVAVMAGHTGPVKSLCVVSDMAMGFLVYSGSMDGDIRVWWLPEDETDCLSSSDSDGPVVVNWRSENGGVRKRFA